MSVQATSWVLRDGPRMNDVDRHGRRYGTRARGFRAVLFTIADAANRDGEHAHPGVRAIVDGSLYSKAHALAIIEELVAEGWLEITEKGVGRGNATVYSVTLERRAAAAEKVRSSDQSGEGQKVSQQSDASAAGNGPTTGPFALGNGPILDEERSDLTDEKVRSEPRAHIPQPKPTEDHNLSGADAPRATDDPVVKRAHELTVLAFEQQVKPAIAVHGRGSAFAAVLANITAVLRAGHADEHLETAITHGDVFGWTISGLTVAVNKTARNRGRPTVAKLRDARDRAAARDAADEAAS